MVTPRRRNSIGEPRTGCGAPLTMTPWVETFARMTSVHCSPTRICALTEVSRRSGLRDDPNTRLAFHRREAGRGVPLGGLRGDAVKVEAHDVTARGLLDARRKRERQQGKSDRAPHCPNVSTRW